MALPTLLEPVEFYAGDELIIVVKFMGEDRSAKNFVAQIRKDTESSDKWSFNVTKTYTAPNTYITLQLSGDSAVPGTDGLSRQIPRNAVWDLEQLSNTGVREGTQFRGTLVGTGDVTR